MFKILKTIVMSMIALVIIGVSIFFAILGYQNEQVTICEVEDKWVKRADDKEKYLVKCGNEVYQITDLFLKGKFNSSDLYADLKLNQKYEITTTGYRLSFFSEYKNINKIKKG